MRRLGAAIALPLVALVLAGSAAGATRDARVAALQVALRANGLYKGDVDGLIGPRTDRAVRRLQARAKITVDGIVGPQTRKALGKLGRPGLGTRTLKLASAAGTSRHCSSASPSTAFRRAPSTATSVRGPMRRCDVFRSGRDCVSTAPRDARPTAR